MELLLGLCGWVLAGGGSVYAVAAMRSRGDRAEATARAMHELRGPLTAARLGVELGLRVDGLSGERLRALDLELQRATLALNDLDRRREAIAPAAALAAAPSGEEVAVGQLLEDSVEGSRAFAERREVALTAGWAGTEAWVRGDRVRLAQAVGNLIANAVEHGGGGEVRLKGQRLSSVVRVEVRDFGPGLPRPVAELAARPRWGRGARGRGLAIALAIAEDHGGRLSAAPAERGARLVLELPACEARKGGALPGD